MKVRRFVVRAAAVSLALSFAMSGASIALAGEIAKVNVTAAGIGYSYSYDTSATTVDGADLAQKVNDIAASFNVTRVNAAHTINAKRRRVDFTAPRTGRTLNTGGSVKAITDELNLRIADPAYTRKTVALPYTTLAPSVTHLDKTIMVVLKQRKIYLYNESSLMKTYPCAIGMPRYPTPTGTFVIARKVKNPSWTNPGGAWGRGMPRYIKPGPRNPLGTRALYLYRSGHDTGIRFHGTSNTGSIGHAASHGCMRMKRKDVEKFFTQVPVGTTVFVVK